MIIPKNGLTVPLGAPSKERMVNGMENHMEKGKDKGAKRKLMSTMDVNGGNLDPLSLLAEAASMDQQKMNSSKAKSKGKGDKGGKNSAPCSTLRDLLTRAGGATKTAGENKKSKTSFDDVLQKVAEKTGGNDSTTSRILQLSHYIPKNGPSMLGRDTPIPQYTLTETSMMYPGVPHSWLDHGRLLRLMDPRNKNNLKLFQQQWARSQVGLVMVALEACF